MHRLFTFVLLLISSSFSVGAQDWTNLANSTQFKWKNLGEQCVVGRNILGDPKIDIKGCSDAEVCFLALYVVKGIRKQKWAWERKSLTTKKFANEAESRGYSAASCDAIVQRYFSKVFGISDKKYGASSTKKTVYKSKLKQDFEGLSVNERKQVQGELKKSGYYRSVIDGLYGKGTANALNAYNKEYLGNADLTKKANVDALFADILKPLPSEDPQVVAEQVEPVSTNPEPEPAVAPAVEPEELQPTIADMQEAYDSQDYFKAREAAEALAIVGEADAQFLLGKMYANGLGALQISKTAHMWFNIASLNGSAEAITERNAVAETMTASAVEEAQELALKCIQSKYADCGLSVKPKQTPEAQQPVLAAIVDGAALGNDFKAQSVLRRKQLQYALKKLGVYSSSVDGLWGNGTSTAFTNYIKINDLKASSGEDVFASVLSKVDVPTAFAAPKRKIVKKQTSSHRTTNTAGLKPIISNPTMSGAQALAICKPQGELAFDQASNSYNSTDYGSSINCSGFGSSFNCNSSNSSGGVWGGLARGLGRGLAGVDARNAVMKSCLAQYGWKK